MSDFDKSFSPEKDGLLRGRQLEFFHHNALEEWGGVPQKDSFAVLHPVKKKRKTGLYVVLHSSGHGLYSCLNCTMFKGNHDIYHTPEDLFGLYLDCRENETQDWWWGGRRPDLETPGQEDAMLPVEKRVIATILWTIQKYKLDPERVYLCGNSMGGSGVLGIGMNHGDLFAAIKANVPAGVLHMMDRCFQKGKSLPDPPLCIDYSAQNDTWSKGHDIFYRAMRENKFALYGYWADFGHANNDEVMLEKNDLIHSFPWLSLRKNEAYPVFTNASSDTPNPWENDPGKVPSAGQVNGFFRWKKGKDTSERFTVKLFLLTENNLKTSFPIPEKAVADLSLRRLQLFKIQPGEKIAWKFGSQSGIAKADEKGLLTLSALTFTGREETLELKRVKE